MQYAEIICDHRAGYEPLTYAIPPEYLAHLHAGSVVMVPIGKQVIHGVLYRFVRRVDSRLQRKLKPIDSIIYAEAYIPEYLLEAAHQLHHQYGYHFGEVLFTFLPPLPRKTQTSVLVETIPTPGFSLTEYVLPLHNRIEAYNQIAQATLEQGLSLLILCPNQSSVQAMAKQLSSLGLTCQTFPSPSSPKEQKEFYLSIQRLTEPAVIIGTRGALITPLQKVGRIVVEEPWFPGHKEERSPRLWTALAAQALSYNRKIPLAVCTTLSWPDTQLLGAAKRYTVRANYGHLQLVPNRSISEVLTHFLSSFDEPNRLLAILVRENITTFYWCPHCRTMQPGENCVTCDGVTVSIPPLTKARIEAQLALLQPKGRVVVQSSEELLQYSKVDAILALGFDAFLSIVDFRSPAYLSSLLLLIRAQAKVIHFATSFPDNWTQINHHDLAFFANQAVSERRDHRLPPFSLAVQLSARTIEALHKLPPLAPEAIIQQGRIRQEGREFIQSYLLRRASRLPRAWYMAPEVKIDIFPNYIHAPGSVRERE